MFRLAVSALVKTSRVDWDDFNQWIFTNFRQKQRRPSSFLLFCVLFRSKKTHRMACENELFYLIDKGMLKKNNLLKFPRLLRPLCRFAARQWCSVRAGNLLSVDPAGLNFRILVYNSNLKDIYSCQLTTSSNYNWRTPSSSIINFIFKMVFSWSFDSAWVKEPQICFIFFI